MYVRSACLYQQDRKDLKGDGAAVQLAKIEGTDEHFVLKRVVRIMRT